MASLIPLLTGCASIVSKSTYPVMITSNPPGATVMVKDKRGMEMHRAQTPATLPLKSSAGFFTPAGYTFDFEKEGSHPTSTSMSAGIDPWYFGNFIFGGLIGLVIVDPATGAMWKLEDRVIATLPPDPASRTSSAPAVPSPPASQSSSNTVEQLKKLKELKDAGLITDEEYETKRKDILQRM